MNVKGAIMEKGGKWYTHLFEIFNGINNKQLQYNWLITDCNCFPKKKEYDELFSNEYIWLTGEELTKIVHDEDFQWIWAVLSGFPKDISFDRVLEYELPYADGYRGFWEEELTIQHPLAEVEIVPWDSSLVLVISKDEKIVSDFHESFPLAQDLGAYNRS